MFTLNGTLRVLPRMTVLNGRRGLCLRCACITFYSHAQEERCCIYVSTFVISVNPPRVAHPREKLLGWPKRVLYPLDEPLQRDNIYHSHIITGMHGNRVVVTVPRRGVHLRAFASDKLFKATGSPREKWHPKKENIAFVVASVLSQLAAENFAHAKENSFWTPTLNYTSHQKAHHLAER